MVYHAAMPQLYEDSETREETFENDHGSFWAALALQPLLELEVAADLFSFLFVASCSVNLIHITRNMTFLKGLQAGDNCGGKGRKGK